jgi:linoleoyl-CoA desaturase
MTAQGLPMAEGDTASDAGKPLFARDDGFHREVKRRVQAYFDETGLSRRDSPRMYLKTVMLLLWFGVSYGLLVFGANALWQGALLSLSLAFAMAGIGFGIQHDANHGAYSRHPAVNRAMGMMLDMLGASSYMWRFKHNISHHTFTNIEGVDDDIDFVPFARLAPEQPRYRMHRFQHVYLWALYWFLFPKWNFVDDFKALTRGRISGHTVPRPRGASLVELIAGKAMFFGWAFALPLFYHPWWLVLLFYVATSLVLGTTLAVVFMLAHCVEEAQFPQRPDAGQRLPRAWAAHQVETTVDFAPRNRLLTWYAGGLNFQIEHHLFPRICHVHYPKLAPIVQAVSAEYGVSYACHPTFHGAFASHWRWLRRMGRLPGTKVETKEDPVEVMAAGQSLRTTG